MDNGENRNETPRLQLGKHPTGLQEKGINWEYYIQKVEKEAACRITNHGMIGKPIPAAAADDGKIRRRTVTR